MREPHSFDIIVPTYNMSAHLNKLMESMTATGLLELANQVIFVDDGSGGAEEDDGTEEWMAFFVDLEGRPLGLMGQYN